MSPSRCVLRVPTPPGARNLQAAASTKRADLRVTWLRRHGRLLRSRLIMLDGKQARLNERAVTPEIGKEDQGP
eukprot:1969043-Rhodomonas_salina.1